MPTATIQIALVSPLGGAIIDAVIPIRRPGEAGLRAVVLLLHPVSDICECLDVARSCRSAMSALRTAIEGRADYIYST